MKIQAMRDQIQQMQSAIASCQEAMNEVDDHEVYDSIVGIIQSIGRSNEILVAKMEEINMATKMEEINNEEH